MQLLSDTLPKKLNKWFHPKLLSVVVTLLLVPRLRASFRQIVWQTQKYPFLSTRASGSTSQLPLCAKSHSFMPSVPFLNQHHWFCLEGRQRSALSWDGGKDTCGGCFRSRSWSPGHLVRSKSYSCPTLTPQRSSGAAWPQSEQLLCPNSQPGPENLVERILQYAPWQ